MPGRDNGLEASSYTPLTDLEPQLADAILEALRDEGVAAYVVPATQQSAGLAVKEFRGPLDQLWVDATAKPRAQQVLDTCLPALREDLERQAAPSDSSPAATAAPCAPPGQHPDQSDQPASADEQAAWAAIVASFNNGPDSPVPPWPVAEDVQESETDSGETDADEPAAPSSAPSSDAPSSSAPPSDPSAQTAVSTASPGPQRASGLPADDHLDRPDLDRPAGDGDHEEHFVPPPPPPLPRTDPVTKAAWAGLLGGPVYLFLATLAGISVGAWGALLAATAFMGGFVTLVVRMGNRPPADSGPDDGAVV